MNSTVSLTLSPRQIDELASLYQAYAQAPSNPYITALYKLSDCTISVYTSHKVVFQGESASHYAQSYQNQFKAHAGSDEVGTGDYFGPVVVVAAYVDDACYQKIKHLGITDSKALTDEMIQKIATEIRPLVPHSLLIVDNRKYNEIHQVHNMNAIKALLHNQAYLHLKKRIKVMPDLCVVDQFTPKTSYLNYLRNEKNIFRELHFETKAESKYMAVAVASILARDAFLQSFETLNQSYDFIFPKGGGSQVDAAAIQFVKRYGIERLEEVAKLHFKNTERVV